MFISSGFHPMFTSLETNKRISWLKRVVMLLHPSLQPSPTLRGLDLNAGEGVGVCENIVPGWHRGILNILRAKSPLMWFVEGEDRWETS
ncbi:hypothetical protein TNCV_4139311 [Trichonephila clavipes]|nr:hypothetical protein TNCV_4139311 [Trichonephila clavipes]